MKNCMSLDMKREFLNRHEEGEYLTAIAKA